MPRSTNAVASKARKTRMLKLSKGYWGRRKNVWTVAKNAIERGLQYAYRDRKNKKREFRSLWIQRINAGVRALGYSYSNFIGEAVKKNMMLNRKVLADLAVNNVSSFNTIVTGVMLSN